MTDSDTAAGDGRHVRSMTVVRHGQTSYNAGHRMQGQIDIPLNSVGRWQVERTAEELRAEYVDDAPEDRHLLVVSSDLGRAAATAHAFADPLGQMVHLDPGLRERSFGEWEEPAPRRFVNAGPRITNPGPGAPGESCATVPRPSPRWANGARKP